MPAKYHEGAKKAYKSGRSPAYNDIESIDEQKEKERMLREQIRRKFGNGDNDREKEIPVWMKKDYNIFAGNLRNAIRRLKKKV